MRHSGRENDEIRQIEIIPNFNPYAEGSCLIKCGNTHVVCTVSMEEKVPAWLRGQNRGWLLPSMVCCRGQRKSEFPVN